MKKYFIRSIVLMFLFSLSIVCLGCGGGGSSSGQVPTQLPIIFSDCVVMTSSLSDSGIISSVVPTDNHIVLDKAVADKKGITKGSILVVPVSDNCPEGVARKIVWMTDAVGKYDVKTVPATMADIYDQIDIAEDNVLIRPSDTMINVSGDMVPFNRIRGGIKGRNVTVTPNEANTGFQYAFTEYSLYDGDGNSATTNDAILLSGVTEIEIRKTAYYIKKRGELLPRDALFTLTFIPKVTLLRVKIGVEVNVLNADFHKALAPPLTVPVPLVASTLEIQPEVGVQIGLSVKGGYEWETNQSLTVKGGIHAWSDGWAPSSIQYDTFFSASHIPSTGSTQNYSVDFEVKPYIGAIGSLKLGGIIGPYAQADFFGKYAYKFLPAIHHLISVGTEAITGIKADIWGFLTLFDVNMKLDGAEWTVYDSGIGPTSYDIRDYGSLRVGDYSIRQDGFRETIDHIETLEGVTVTAIYIIQSGGGSAFEELWAFDPADGKQKLYGIREGVSPDGTMGVLYKIDPPVVVGTSSMKIGDTFPNTYKKIHAITGAISQSYTMNITFAGVETVTTPAGTFTDCLKYTVQRDEGTSTGWLAKGIGMVKETVNGKENPAVYIYSNGVEYGTKP